MPPGSLLLADATLVRNFTQAGRPCAQALLEWATDDLFMVREVYRELARHQGNLPALQWFLSQLPPLHVHDLGLEDLKTVGQIAKAVAVPGEHTDANIGEIATVVYATRRMGAGDDICVIIDDLYGKDLARSRDIPVIDTPAIVRQMVGSGDITAQDGARVGRECFSDPERQRRFHADLKEFSAARH